VEKVCHIRYIIDSTNRLDFSQCFHLLLLELLCNSMVLSVGS
jgi:hypothetical protein